MALFGYDKLILTGIRVIIFHIVRAVFGLFQTIWWLMNGTLRRIHESKKPENYNRCVHVMNIVHFETFDLLKEICRTDYILTHDRFESPQYIFHNDHVTLLTLEKDGAIFVEARPGQYLWRSEFSSFIRFAQMAKGVKLLFVPKEAFLRMTQELGELNEKLIVLFNTARCGSTLFTQIMEMSEACVPISEPDALNKLCRWQQEGGDKNELKTLVKAAVRWICRPYNDLPFKPRCYAVKVTAPSVRMLDLVDEVYPECLHLFMYRGVVKNAQSIVRLSQEFPLLKLAIALGKVHAYFVEAMLDAIGFHGEHFRVKVIDDIDFGIFVWIVMANEYLVRKKAGYKASALRYEDLADKKTARYAVSVIMKFAGLEGEEVVDKAMRGLQMDSQRNTPMSREILAKHKDPDLTPGAIERANVLLKKYNMPLIGEELLFEGTITCPSQ